MTALKAAETCLQQIHVAGGYYTDAGDHVTREPETLQPKAQGTAVAVAMVGLELASDDRLARTHQRLVFAVVAKVAADLEQAQARMHELIDDVQQAFVGQQARFPKGTTFPTFESATPIPPAKDESWIGAIVRFSCHVLRRQPA